MMHRLFGDGDGLLEKRGRVWLALLIHLCRRQMVMEGWNARSTYVIDGDMFVVAIAVRSTILAPL